MNVSFEKCIHDQCGAPDNNLRLSCHDTMICFNNCYTLFCWQLEFGLCSVSSVLFNKDTMTSVAGYMFQTKLEFASL